MFVAKMENEKIEAVKVRRSEALRKRIPMEIHLENEGRKEIVEKKNYEGISSVEVL